MKFTPRFALSLVACALLGGCAGVSPTRIIGKTAGAARDAGFARVYLGNGDVDALIAATALVNGLSVVTRNVRDFEGTGVVVIDPWQSTT